MPPATALVLVSRELARRENHPPRYDACEYGPMAAGAEAVKIGFYP